MRGVLSLLVLLTLASPVWAGAATDCSQSVGTTAAAVPFPASGAHGPSMATVFLDLCNSHATQNLGVNWSGGTAAIGSQGTQTLAPGQCKSWGAPAVPASVSVIGSAASTTTACAYQ